MEQNRVLLGAPLAGKSELLALLSGEEQPGRGSVELLGREIREWPSAKRRRLAQRWTLATFSPAAP